MAKTVSIPWPAGLMGHGEVHKTVVLQEPSYSQYLKLGDPVQLIHLGDGRYVYNELPGVIEEYISLCVKTPNDPILLEQGGMKLAREVKSAILGFFQPDDGETAPSKSSGTTSSGGAETAASAPTT